jgi:FkbM family methyltransferase
LLTLPEEQLKRLAGTAFIDAGAFIGDSALILQKYAPSRIYAFEPSQKNCKVFREIMNRNHVTPDRYELITAGLGDVNVKMHNFNDTGNEGTSIHNNDGSSTIDICTLDSYWKEEYGRIGFIKADVEGAAVELMRGAEQTIRKYLPVLSIAVYHNETEFFGVYELLKSWNLSYRIEFQKHYYCWDNAEIVLIATPEC